MHSLVDGCLGKRLDLPEESEKRMSWQRQWIEVRGHRLYLERNDKDNAPLVVLLHHGLGSVQAWRAQMDFLQNKDFSVFVYDRWGYGHSDDRPHLDPPYFEEDVRDLAEILAHETKPLVLVGHSDGGNVALTYASRYGRDLFGVIVIAAHIYFEPKMAKGIQELWRSYQNNETFQTSLNHIHCGKVVFERWFQAWSKIGIEWDMRSMCSLISCPVLVLQGSEDEHASVQHAFDLAAALPFGKVRILEGADHMLPQKTSALFNQILFETLLDFQMGNQHVQ